ncbi:alpha/beta hydrolase [Slackia heliotrinireducens]|uniref:alpha/beta hydrolase n=1 Tax=Slackia heliotrinireducens TaxID=84110 RepID=UPI0033158623
MSVQYKAAETLLNLINRVTRGGLKAVMLNLVKDPPTVDDVPESFYNKYDCRRLMVEGRPVVRVRTQTGVEPQAALVYLAGGGGTMGPLQIHFDMVEHLAKLTGFDVYLAFYPLAPKHNALEARQWLDAVQERLADDYPADRIFFGGDSSGANVAIAHTAHQVAIGFDVPAGVIAVSPATGLADGEARDIRLQAEADDPYLSVAMNDYIATVWGRGMDLSSGDYCPSGVDFTGFPPMMLFYGTHELFCPHDDKLVERIQAAGVELDVTRSEGLCHCWAVLGMLPEAKRAQRRMAEWMAARIDVEKEA